jgi:hypothetical protein
MVNRKVVGLPGSPATLASRSSAFGPVADDVTTVQRGQLLTQSGQMHILTEGSGD